jgi:superfamily II DNA or RNA helicase
LEVASPASQACLPSSVAAALAEALVARPSQLEVLRAYQVDLIDRLRAEVAAGRTRILVQAPTGAGKTHVIASVVLLAQTAGLRALVLATRTRLVRQIAERLDGFGVDFGVIAAALRSTGFSGASTQVASVDTVYRRCIADARSELPPADVVIFDEAHLALGNSRLRLLARYPHAVVVGFTATPAKHSGRTLGDFFEVLLGGPTVGQLIEAGQLVRPVIFAAPIATKRELSKIQKDSKSGDYASGELAALVSQPKLVGDVLANWLRIAAGRRTIVFAVNKAHAAALTAEFLRAGIPAEMLCDEDPEARREEVLDRLERGVTTVVVNAFLLSYGLDIPTVECVVLARPTRSVVLYLQAIGRGMRTAPGKDRIVVIDHGRVVESLGLPTADFAWSLDRTGNVNVAAREARKRHASADVLRTCADCQAMWSVRERGPTCVECGWTPTPAARAIAVQDAELVELGAAPRSEVTSAQALQFMAEALAMDIQRRPDVWRERPNRCRWLAWKQTSERFGLPSDPVPKVAWRVNPTRPSAATRAWLKSRQIAWAKARDRARNAGAAA